jgi:hypothetical protein
VSIKDFRDERIARAIEAIPIPEPLPGLVALGAKASARNIEGRTLDLDGDASFAPGTSASSRPGFASRRRFRRTALLAAALATAAAVVAGLALAGVFAERTAEPASQVGSATAQHLFAYHTSWGEQVDVWAATTADGRRCAFFPLNDVTAHTKFDGVGPSFCPIDGASASEPPSMTMIASFVPRADGTLRVLVNGAATPSSSIADVRLEGSTGGLTSVESKDGYFVAELPGVTSDQSHLPPGGPFYLVAYDQAGKPIVRRSLEGLIEGP